MIAGGTTFPIYSYGPFDICLWDIAGKIPGMPLYALLGAYRKKVPVYARLMVVLNSPEDYAKQALEVEGPAAGTLSNCIHRAKWILMLRLIARAGRQSDQTSS